MDTCSNCGAKLVGNKTFCLRCGRAVAQYRAPELSVVRESEAKAGESNHCLACGAERADAGQRYCGMCGAELTSESGTTARGYSPDAVGGDDYLTPSPAPPRARTLVLGSLALFVTVLSLYAWWAYGAAQSRLEERIDSLGEALILAHEAAVSSDPVKSSETYRAAELKAQEAYGMPSIDEFMNAYSLLGNAGQSPEPSVSISRANETLARARYKLRQEFEATSEPSAVAGTWVFHHGDITLSETGQWTQGGIAGTWAPLTTGLSPGAIVLTRAVDDGGQYEMLVLKRVPNRALVFRRLSGNLEGVASRARK